MTNTIFSPSLFSLVVIKLKLIDFTLAIKIIIIVYLYEIRTKYEDTEMRFRKDTTSRKQ